MSVEVEPAVLMESPGMELSLSDLDMVRKFIIANKDLLNRLGEDLDIDDFIKAMITV